MSYRKVQNSLLHIAKGHHCFLVQVALTIMKSVGSKHQHGSHFPQTLSPDLMWGPGAFLKPSAEFKEIPNGPNRSSDYT